MRNSEDDATGWFGTGPKVYWAVLLYLLTVALVAALTYYDARRAELAATSAQPVPVAIGQAPAEPQTGSAVDTRTNPDLRPGIPADRAQQRAAHAVRPAGRVLWTLGTALVLFVASLPIFVTLNRDLRDRNVELERALDEYERDADRLPSLDELTGQYNRPGFERLLDAELVRCKRHGLDCCVAMLDIDGFAELREGRGQASADAVLMQCAARTASVIRGCDVLARLDGERFGLILPQTSLARGIVAGERIRDTLSGAPMGMPDGADELAITASIGIASVRETEADREPLQALVQGRLQQAVEAGRDRLIAADA